MLAIADQMVAKLVLRSSSRSERELYLKVDVFRRDYACRASFRVLPEEEEALLTTTHCKNWCDFISCYQGWIPIHELPTIRLPVAFASMVLSVHRYKGPNRENIEMSLRNGDEWGFGPG